MIRPPSGSTTRKNKRGHSVTKTSDGNKIVTGTNKKGLKFIRHRKDGKLVSSRASGKDKKGRDTTVTRGGGTRTATKSLAPGKTRTVTKDAKGAKTVTTRSKTKAGLMKTKTKGPGGVTSVTRARKPGSKVASVTKRSDGTKTKNLRSNFEKGKFNRKVDVDKSGKKTYTFSKTSKNGKRINTYSKTAGEKRKKISSEKNRKVTLNRPVSKPSSAGPYSSAQAKAALKKLGQTKPTPKTNKR